MSLENVLKPNWPLPNHVKALVTQKNTLLSEVGDFGFNLALHVNDDRKAVLNRRSVLVEKYNLPDQPVWLQQVHGNRVICLENYHDTITPEADASFTFVAGNVCVVSTADCLPILLSDIQGRFVAAIHAGWQGLHKKIISETVDSIRNHPKGQDIRTADMFAYIGPAISQNHYQVGHELEEAFINQEALNARFFKEDEEGKFLADLKGIARRQLEKKGIGHILDSGICSYENEDFYSYRKASKEKAVCGRFASMIWLEQ